MKYVCFSRFLKMAKASSAQVESGSSFLQICSSSNVLCSPVLFLERHAGNCSNKEVKLSVMLSCVQSRCVLPFSDMFNTHVKTLHCGIVSIKINSSMIYTLILSGV